MKKLKLIFLLAGLLSIWQVRAQIAIPITAQNVPFGNQTLTAQTITGSNKWYHWTSNAGFIEIKIKLLQQGNVNQLFKAELYTLNSSSLTLAYSDYISSSVSGGITDSILRVYAGALNLNDDVYINIINTLSTCTSCSITNPLVNISFSNIMAGCAPVTPCDMVKNGGFESSISTGCGYDITDGADCWFPYEGSTDVYRRGCFGATVWPHNLGFSTQNTSPPLNSHNPSPNNTIVGQYCLLNPYWNPYQSYSESIQTILTTPFVSGKTYSLSCWLYNYSGQINTSNYANPMAYPCIVTFGTSSGLAVTTSTDLTTYVDFPNNPGVINHLTNFHVIAANVWTQFTYTFTYSGPGSNNCLLFGPNLSTNESYGYVNHTDNRVLYLASDDVSLIDITPITVSASSSTVCAGAPTILTASNSSASYTWQPGGLFGSTVTVSPTVPTVYTVTPETPIGCIHTPILTTVSIVPGGPSATVTATNYSVCPGGATTLTAVGSSGVYYYSWQTGSTYLGSSSTITVNPLVTTTYSLTAYGLNGCISTKTISILVAITPTITVPGHHLICPNESHMLTGTGAVSYTWQPSGVVSNFITVSPSVTTTYTVFGTGICGGIGSNTVLVTVEPKPTISITSTLSNLCSAVSSGSTTVLSYATSPSGTSATWVATNATSGAILPVPITGGASTATVNLTSYINYTANINFVATFTSSGGCIGTQTITLYACCTPTAGVAKYTNTTFASGLTFTATAIILSGTITVNAGTLGFLNTNVYMDPNTKIILKGTSAFAPQRIYMHGCNAMWDGIYAIGSSHNIQIASCRIEDAKRAIVDSLGTARLNVSNSYFNKNNIGIVIKGTKPSTSPVNIITSLFTCSTISVTPTTWFSVAPALTNSTAIGAFPSTTMLPPYNMYNSYCGVYLYNAKQAGVTNSVIPIGVSTTTTGNIFNKMKAGIVNYQSNMNVQKNLFQNITSAMNNPGELFIPNSGAVFVANYFGTGTYNSNIGGSIANKNTFYNNEYGVYNVGRSNLNVTYNKFENQTNGVYITANNNNLAVNVSNNNFYKSQIGINFYNNAPKIQATIKDNNIDNSSATVGAFNTNYAIYCSEAVAPTSAANTTTYTVSNNNIKNYYNGIWSAQTLSTTINDNEVHMAQDNANDHWQRGIRVENSNTPKVNNNIVDIPSLNQWAYWQLGIDMGSNQVPRVQCNSVTNLCMGLTLSGPNITTPGDGIIGNYLQNNAYGIWLLNNGEIGSQFKTVGTTTLSADNAWDNYTCSSCWYTYVEGSSNWLLSGTSKLYTRSSGIYNLPSTKAGVGSFSFLLIGNPTTASSGTCNAATPTPTNVRLGGSSVAKLRQNGEADADDYNLNGANMCRTASVNLSEADDISNNTISKRAINHYQLYRSVKLQGIDVKASQAMLSFMNGAKTDNLGLFFAIDSLLHNAETDSMYIPSARYLNNSITVKNKVDKTHKAFNELYASYLAQHNTLKPTEISSLEDIAYLCPAIYGNAVYQARAVLFGIKKQSYMSDCEKVTPTKSSKKVANAFEGKAEVVVYPNPANSELFVNAIGYNEVTIKLYNIMGALVLEKIIAPNQSININNLVNGIYTYKIYSSNNELKTDKLIIIK